MFKSHGALQRERNNPYPADLVAELKKTFSKTHIKAITRSFPFKFSKLLCLYNVMQRSDLSPELASDIGDVVNAAVEEKKENYEVILLSASSNRKLIIFCSGCCSPNQG